MFTKTTLFHKPGEGGGSGGDQHNLGWYATPEALRTAHATATAGDWAIVGSTDTVWIWDTDTSAWKDSSQEGQVASVNGQTGTVVLTASDVGAATAAQGTKADTAVQPADLATVATTGDYDDLTNKPTIPAAQVNSDWNASSGVAQILNKPTLGTAASADTTDFATAAQGALADTAVQPSAIADMETQTHASATYATKSELADKQNIIQYSTMPTASADNVGDIVQFVGTTTASYTNGYFYKCVSDGADPATYSWEEVEVQASSGGGLPSQTGQSGKFLTTDGTDASWSNKPLVNNATSSLFPDTCLSILGQNNQQGYVTTVGAGTQSSGSGTAVGYAAKANGQYGVAVGRESVVSGDNGVAVGYRNTAGKNGICLGDGNSMSVNGIAVGNGISSSGFNSISIGFKVGATAAGAIQLGGNANLSSNIINNETGTLKVCLSTSIANTFNYKLLDSDGTIPAARHAALPSADGTYVLKLVIASGVPTLSWVAEQ